MGTRSVATRNVVEVGDNCFWNGCAWRVVGAEAKNWVLMPMDLSGFTGQATAKVVAKTEVEELCTDRFRIGDRVSSKYFFIGTVTGFEPEENRIVCRSDKIDSYSDILGPGSGRRARWAYKPNELLDVNDERVFKENHKYRINGIDCKATKGRHQEILFMLENGAPWFSLPSDITQQELKTRGFTSVIAL